MRYWQKGLIPVYVRKVNCKYVGIGGWKHCFLQGLPEGRKGWHIFLLLFASVEHTNSRVSQLFLNYRGLFISNDELTQNNKIWGKPHQSKWKSFWFECYCTDIGFCLIVRCLAPILQVSFVFPVSCYFIFTGFLTFL